MKLDQVAYYAREPKEADAIKAMLGLSEAEWVQDTVTGAVDVYRRGHGVVSGVSRALLQFNYDLGIETEILTYLDGPHWHQTNHLFLGTEGFLSHLGYHLDDGEEFPEYDAPLVQEMFTREHTNPYLLGNGRKFHYRIWDTRPTLGVFTKVIRRIHAQKP